MQGNSHYSSTTMMRGAQLFAEQTQAEVDTLIIELNLEDEITTGNALSKAHKVNRIIEYTKNNPEHQTMEGSNLIDGLVEKSRRISGRTEASMEGEHRLQRFCQSLEPRRVHIGGRRNSPPNTSRSG